MTHPPDKPATDPAETLPQPGETRRCVRCQFKLQSLPTAARFCPRCGLPLGEAAAPAPAADAHSRIIVGYGNAMHRLGGRYERGVWNNQAEAMRCYRKAAQLGNAPAAQRLRDESAGPADPPRGA